MIDKSFRLSAGFWHKFLPNSNKLFSPQNIPIEIWNIDKRAKESKWNPGIYGIENLTFSNHGDKFAIMGSWITSSPNQSECRIYDTNTLQCIDFFFISEKCTNPKFTKDDTQLIFGTWDENIYYYHLKKKSLIKQLVLENHTINLTHHGKLDTHLYAAVTKKVTEYNNNTLSYVLEYDLEENIGTPIYFSDDAAWSVRGLALYGSKLAVLTASYGGKENDSTVHLGKAFIYNTETKETALVKENFKIRDIFDDCGSIVWNHCGDKLAFIGLHEVTIINIKTNNEITLPFDGATSVEFSNCDTGVAVGGKKAKIFKLD